MQQLFSYVFGAATGAVRTLVLPAAVLYGVYVGQAAGGGSTLQLAPWAVGAAGLLGDAQARGGEVMSLLRLALHAAGG